MIFSSFNQVNNVLIFIFFGIVLCLFYITLEILFLLNFKKIFKNIIFNTFFYIFFAIIYIFLINIFNFGLFNIVLLGAFILGFIWFKIASKNLVVFLKNKWYTIISKRKQNAKPKKS